MGSVGGNVRWFWRLHRVGVYGTVQGGVMRMAGCLQNKENVNGWRRIRDCVAKKWFMQNQDGRQSFRLYNVAEIDKLWGKYTRRYGNE